MGIHLVNVSEPGTVLRHALHASVVFENAPSSFVQYKY